MAVDLPLRTSAFHLKEEVQNKLLNEYRIRIPREKLILRKEGILRPLKPEDVLQHHPDGNDMLYIIGRIPENIDQPVAMEVD
ncbi:MAG: hypothetical protein ACK5PQ_00930 [Alphaproteobacteria bacterium]